MSRLNLELWDHFVSPWSLLKGSIASLNGLRHLRRIRYAAFDDLRFRIAFLHHLWVASQDTDRHRLSKKPIDSVRCDWSGTTKEKYRACHGQLALRFIKALEKSKGVELLNSKIQIMMGVENHHLEIHSVALAETGRSF
jgi:hypothetical protein